MLRNRIVNGQKASDATYVAHTNLVRGMAVVKATEGKTAFVGEATDAGVFLVDRDNLPSGTDCVYADRPDVAFDKIAEGDLVKLVPYVNGESFYTDQYDAGAEVAGTALGVGVDGKWEALEGGTKYVSRGTETVAGKVMLAVEVIA
jgi:hypothetical protein